MSGDHKFRGFCAMWRFKGVTCCVVGVTSELTMSQAHVLSVTCTQLNNGVHLLFASPWILMPLVDSLACRPTKIQQTSRIN